MKAHPKALFDLSVLVDALHDTPNSDGSAAAALALTVQGRLHGYLGAGALDSLHDLLNRRYGARGARDQLRALRAQLAIAPVDGRIVDAALALGWPYLDDALTYECARLNGMEYLVTLNGEDIPGRAVQVCTPEELLRLTMFSGLRVANG